MKILADATLTNISVYFTHPFTLSTYRNDEELQAKLKGQQILICRSTLKVNAKLLSGSNVQCIATASSGTDHIDEQFIQEEGITLFDAKGCNANSVSDYVVSTLAWLKQRQLLGKGRAGVIGCGKTGSEVMVRLKAAGFETICYDPIKNDRDPKIDYCNLEALYNCDLLCIHANLHTSHPYPSRNLIHENFISKLKPHTVIINTARGGIVEEDVLIALSTRLIYCTDVYQNEPAIAKQLIERSTLCTPHIAGHSIEGKMYAIDMVSQKIHDHYGLESPSINIRTNNNLILPLGEWDEIALSLYNPFIDTQALKLATDIEQTFLELRKAHQYRHDYNRYQGQKLSQKTKLLLGMTNKTIDIS